MYVTEEDIISHPLIEDITMGSNIFQESSQFVLQKIGKTFKSGEVPILPYIKLTMTFRFICIHCIR